MSEALDRIEALREAGEAAIAGAADADALEEARVRFLGRKSELTSILRGIGELPAEERGPVGSGANAARQALEALLERRRDELEEAALESRLAGDGLDVTLPGNRPVGVGHLHLITQTWRELEDIFVGLGYRVADGPEIEHDYYNFTALNHPPGHPARMVQDTFYVDAATLPEGVVNEHGLPPGPKDVLLRTHTSPVQVRSMEAQEPPIFIVVPGAGVSPRLRRDAHPDVLPGGGARGGRGRDPGRPRRHAPGGGPGDLRPRAGDPPASRTSSPSRSPRCRWTSPASTAAAAAGWPTARATPCARAPGWIEILGAGMVDPHVLGFVPSERLRPRARAGLRLRHGDRADRDAQARRPGPAHLLRQRRSLRGAVPVSARA